MTSKVLLCAAILAFSVALCNACCMDPMDPEAAFNSCNACDCDCAICDEGACSCCYCADECVDCCGCVEDACMAPGCFFTSMMSRVKRAGKRPGHGAHKVRTVDPKQRLAEIDTDHDGAISKKEAIHYMIAKKKAADESTLTHDMSWFNKMDKNKNGMIEPGEMDHTLAKKQ